MAELAQLVCTAAGMKKEGGEHWKRADFMRWGQGEPEPEATIQDAFKLLSLTRKK